MPFRTAGVLAALLACACAPVVPKVKPAAPPKTLASFFDCVRTHHGALVSAHRGGPQPGYAENALPTFRHTAADGLALLEMDVRTARDGVMFLLHDDTLDRTTTGHGDAESLPWEALRPLRLKDEKGRLTGASIPRFDAVLAWAKTAPVVLQLDIKGRTRIAPMMRAVRAAGMNERVVIITYTNEQAIRAARLAPGTMLSVSVDNMANLKPVLNGGVDPKLVTAWTGLGPFKPALYQALAARGIESIYGALGKTDARAAKTRGRPYRTLVADGVQIIATDRVKAVRRAISADDIAQSQCALPDVSN